MPAQAPKKIQAHIFWLISCQSLFLIDIFYI